MLLGGVLGFALISLGIKNSLFYIALLVIFAAWCIFGKSNAPFCSLLIMLPYSMVFKLSVNSTSLFTYFMLFSIVIIGVRFRTVNAKILIMWTLLMLFSLVGVGSSYSLWIKLGAATILFYGFAKTAEIEDAKNYAASYGLGMIGSSIIGLDKVTNPAISRFFSDLNQEYVAGEATFRFSGLYMDPNFFSVGVVLVVLLSVLLIVRKQAPKWLFLPMIAALIYFGSLTLSRTFIIAIALAGLLVGLDIVSSSKKVGIAIVISVLVLGLGALLVVNLPAFQSIKLRFEDADITNNRLAIWGNYLKHIFNSGKVILIGKGIGAKYHNNVAAHNTYIDCLYYLGLLGSVVYVGLLSSILHVRSLVNKRTIGNFAILIVLLVVIATLSFFQANDFMFYLMFAWLGLNLKENTGSKVTNGQIAGNVKR